MNRRTLLLAIASSIIGVAACSSGAPPATTATPVSQPAIQEADVPPPLKVPPGNKLTASLDGAGVQIYQCSNGAWNLLQPAATLSDQGKPVGLHFKGPIWVSTLDGSEVGATTVATVNQDGAVPQLLLKTTQNQGQGAFSNVSYVQRLRTNGGTAPSGSCINGVQQAIKYSAVYRFWSASA